MAVGFDQVKDRVLEFASYSPMDAIKGKVALRWAIDPATPPLSQELLKQEVGMLILSLPSVFESRHYKVASSFMKAWLYGYGLDENPFVKYRRYMLFDLADLSTSKTVVSAFADAKNNSLEMIANDGESGFKDPRWMKFREAIRAFDNAQKSAKRTTWVYNDPPWPLFAVAPQWYFGAASVGHVDYLPNELGSDAFASLARFSINKYLQTQVEKREDGSIFVTPKLLGLRVEDQYDFNDDFGLKDVIPGLIANQRASQPLGFYKSDATGKLTSLANEDFENFKKNFADSYNNLPHIKDKLLCNEFSVYSQIRTTKVTGGPYRLVI
ncbi:hypothetical protein [Rhizobium leguminosarum]|uniref:hypothetical protein n=1 Tax=Rhizobium leguminosarum TaxID=384 RepID=UPI003F985E41